MNDDYEKTRVLILVKTYPHPSTKYKELVCTAGITEDGEWVRPYPLDYRYRPKWQQFGKYQWIEIEMAPHSCGSDNRMESRKPNLDSIKIVSDPISKDRNWYERRRIIDPLPHHTLNELKDLYDKERRSIGIVRPKRIIDLEIEEEDLEWKPEWDMQLRQLVLFGPPPKPLKKIPFKFSYVFECEDSSNQHRAKISDWELGALFLNESDRLNDDEKAAESVKNKYFNELCASNRDTRFFMGTTWPFNSWIVIGVFWPPKIKQEEMEFL